MAYAHSSDVKAERGRSCLEGGGIVASGVWQSRADVRQQDLLPYEQRGCTNSVAVRTGWQPVRVASLQIQGCHHERDTWASLRRSLSNLRLLSRPGSCKSQSISSTVLVRHQMIDASGKSRVAQGEIPPLIYHNSPHFECERPESNSLGGRVLRQALSRRKGRATSLSLLRGIPFGDFSPSETKKSKVSSEKYSSMRDSNLRLPRPGVRPPRIHHLKPLMPHKHCRRY